MTIVCKRCTQGFETYLRLYRHLQKKEICPPKKEDVDVNAYMKEIEAICNPFSGPGAKKHDKNKSLRNFGQENLEAIPKQLVHDLFLDLDVKELLRNLFFDPDFPENRNIRLRDKFNSLEFYENNEWHRISLNHGVNKIILRIANIFDKYYAENEYAVRQDMTDYEVEDVLEELEKLKKLDKSVIETLTNSVLAQVKNPSSDNDDKKYKQSKPTRFNIN
jgi:hypothetical protein